MEKERVVDFLHLLHHRRRRSPPPTSSSSSSSIVIVFLLLHHRCHLSPPSSLSSFSSDRGIEPMVAFELQSMAKSLPVESLPSFLSTISDTLPTDKTPFCCHSLCLLYVVSLSHPPSMLLPSSPACSPPPSTALRCICDPEYYVRSACIDAVRSLAASNSHSLSSALYVLLHEQDYSAQMASALCLVGVIDAVDPDFIPNLIYKSLMDGVPIRLSGLIRKGKNEREREREYGCREGEGVIGVLEFDWKAERNRMGVVVFGIRVGRRRWE